jgi:hypothetical protein
MDARNQIQQQRTLYQRLKIKNVRPLVVCFMIIACFTVFGLPAQILWIIFVSASKEIPSYFTLFDALYIFGTAVINPYVYGALDKKVFSLFQHCRKKIRR